MKRSDLKEKSSVFYIGKGIIILSVIVTSSLSFVLGFFVGKSMQRPEVVQTRVIAPPPATEQKNAATEAINVAPQQTQQQAPVSQRPEVPKTPEKPDPPKLKEARESLESGRKVPQPQEERQNGEPRQSRENGNAGTAHDSKQSEDAQKSSKKVKYTVQIGAFKNPKEADSLTAKFSKKGYKAFVTAAKEKKHEKLYKVMLGEFTNSKEAEALSAKIKKKEGLRAFVTLKTEREGIR